MKKTVIISYSALMLLTLLGYGLFSIFRGYNALFCEVSLFVSLMVAIAIITFKIDSVYKISLLIGASVIAAVSYLLAMFMPNQFTNNIPLFVQAILIMIEILALASARYFTKFA